MPHTVTHDDIILSGSPRITTCILRTLPHVNACYDAFQFTASIQGIPSLARPHQ